MADLFFRPARAAEPGSQWSQARLHAEGTAKPGPEILSCEKLQENIFFDAIYLSIYLFIYIAT